MILRILEGSYSVIRMHIMFPHMLAVDKVSIDGEEIIHAELCMSTTECLNTRIRDQFYYLLNDNNIESLHLQTH